MSKKATSACKYCGAKLTGQGSLIFQRNTCLECRRANMASKARAPRSTRKFELQAKWKEFVKDHNLLWYKFKGHKWGGRGSAGAILNLGDAGGPSQPVHVGFFARRTGAWVTVRLVGNDLTFESRCFATWWTDKRYNTLHEWQLPTWTPETCTCGACVATKALINLSRESGPGPASLPEMAQGEKMSASALIC